MLQLGPKGQTRFAGWSEIRVRGGPDQQGARTPEMNEQDDCSLTQAARGFGDTALRYGEEDEHCDRVEKCFGGWDKV